MNHTLYLEADEDITSAIDKLSQAEGHEVRLVVPKRSGLLSSVINLKLLKKAAHDGKKKLVLVTTDSAVVNLASRVGLAVAENVKADAEVPNLAAETPVADAADVIEEDEPFDSAQGKPEELAPEPVIASRPVPDDGPVEDAVPDEPAKKPKGKGLKVPDFGSFQKRLLLGGGVVAAIIALYLLNFFFKSADITIFAKGAQIPSETSFKAVEGAEADPKAGEVSTTTLTDSKDASDSFTATGKKDVGTKAKGSVSIKNCDDTSAHSFAAGSKVTSQGKTFATASTVTIPAGSFSGGGTICNSTTVSVNVTATANGDSYNLAPASYSSPSLNSNYKISGEQMSGGTSKILSVVTATDVSAAKAKLAAADDSIKKDLAQKATSDQIAAKSTFNASVADLTPNPAVGAEGNTFTLSGTIKYTMLAVDKKGLEELINEDVGAKIGKDNQIYDTGAATADITPTGAKNTYSVKTTVFAGAKLDQTKIKAVIKGKKLGAAGDEIEKLAGVDKAEISLSPFWVATVPRITSHIHIKIKVVQAGG